MKNPKEFVTLILLALLLSLSGCLDEIEIWGPPSTPAPVYSFPDTNLPSNAFFQIDSVVHAGDSAAVYAMLSIPDKPNAMVYLHDISINYWNELVSTPDVLNRTDIIKDSVQLDQDGKYSFTSTLVDLTLNTSYRICAESARYVALSDTLTIGGWCTSFSTIE